MRDFFKTFFASLLALCLFVGTGMFLLFGLAVAMAPSEPAIPTKAILVFDLSHPIPDAPADEDGNAALQRMMSGRPELGTPLLTTVKALEQAAHDARIVGLYLTGNVPAAGYASGLPALKEIRGAIATFKASGKPVIAYNQGWSKRDLYVCAGASTLAGNPFGELDLTGLSSEPMFMGGLFKKYGIEVQVARVGQFKGAVEPYITDKLSAPNREQIQKYLDDLWTDWTETVAKDRSVAPAVLQNLADTQGWVTAPDALKAKLLDRTAYVDEIYDTLKRLTGRQAKDTSFPQIALADYAQANPSGGTGERIGVVYAEGDIVDGHGQGQQAGGERVSRELRRLRLDAGVKAVVLRVNSPGGSTLASEVILREVLETRKVKPVVVSMGTLAASGGYWISAQADRIFAEKNTLTGSIGVFALLPNVQKLASDHGITWDRVQTAKMTNPLTLARPKTEAEMARVQALVDQIYDAFLDRVAQGRKLSRSAVHDLAQGRVWSGQEALKLGLVDELGGLQAAIRHAAKLAKIEANFRVDPMPSPRTPMEKFLDLLQKRQSPLAGRQSLPARVQTEVQQALEALAALNDPRGIYARLPVDLRIQ